MSMSTQSLQRKVNRLEIQNMGLREDLEKALIKARTLQQVQVKYQLLLGQSQNENSHLKLNQAMLQKKLQQHIQSILQQHIQQSLQSTRKLQQQHASSILQLKTKHSLHIQELQQKYNQLKQSYQSLSSKSSEIDIFSFKLKKYQKLNAQLQQQLQTQKLLAEQSKQKQLLQLKTSLTKKLKLKYDSQTESYQQRIKQLSKKISQLQLDNDLLQQKNKNLQLSQQSTNIPKLKQILSQRKSIEKGEIGKLQQALDKTNGTLRKMVQQNYDTQQKYLSRQQQLKNHIKQLQTQLLQQQKSHTKQIFTLQQKMRHMNDEQLNVLNEHISALKSQFQQQKKIWTQLSQSHQQQLKQLQQAKTRQWTQSQQQKARLKQKIKQLARRLQQHQGKKTQGETYQMIASLKSMDQKQDNQIKYQNGLVFLERQLRKANMIIDQKNQQIAKLLKQQSQLREQTSSQITQWRQRYSNQKKSLMDRIFSVQNQLRDYSDRLRLREKEMQKSQKEMSFEKIQLQKRIQSLQDINEELKKDYQRMVATNKAIQAEYRGERDKGVTAVGDATYVKRMKWLELQKQKNQLFIVFRQKEQQLKITHEQQIDELRKQRDTLKQKATLMEDQRNILKQQNDKLLKRLQTNSNKENVPNGVSRKKKSGEMQKKIASLNLQIALTKNLFENLQKAKSRLKSRDFTTATVVAEKIPSQGMNQQNNQLQEEDDQY